ncbi:hypothetical protein ES692_09680 [Psychroserpens burtonensis]|uniref:Lipoprotein n=2 Tax=Psychroserpens TaxID=49277 RepID=A0A5C7BAM9_9FLAO|nr:DUF6146 family protein [Psychroserpens burtonensis]TXE17246.1 hypothetical protein ES692_09680 [Psychroserpens burtonensis]
MKRITQLLILALLFVSCGSSKIISNNNIEADIPEEDIVRIANDDLEYEIIIIEPGFNFWLASIARPEGYYSQNFMETRNQQMVIEWNNRVMQIQRYDQNLYELQIDYNSNTDYGYDVNYKLYNYFIYFQLTYKQQLSSFVPRI